MPTERTEPENDAEKLLLEMARIGEIADVSDLTDNVIRGAFLRELATQSTKHGIHEQGVRVKGAYISGKIDFTACSLAQPFWIIESILEKVIRLRVARTRNLGFPGTEIPGLKGDGLRVDGSIFLSSAVFSDELRLLGATITGDLDCIGASFFSAAGFAINAERLVVERRILLLNIKQLEGGIDFMHSRAGDFGDHRSGWPNKGMLIIDGLVYDNLGPEENSAASRIKWLQLMPDTQNDEPVYFPQPYEQLIKVFKSAGHEREARLMAIAKQDAYRDYLRRHAGAHPDDKRRLNRLWLWLIGKLIRYGYEPWRIIWPVIFVLAMGWLVFFKADHDGQMAPAKERVYMHACFDPGGRGDCADWSVREHKWRKDWEFRLPEAYPGFTSLVYSLDTFFPIVDLHQESNWNPINTGVWGGFFRLYLWLHIALGWILTTIGVIGFTGVIKKD